MINHFRTLLLNRDGSDQPGFSYPGEEFVPTAYNAKTLTSQLKTVHQLLFGVNPDRALINWRLRELMAILHHTFMVEAVLDLDPRVTYLPFHSVLFDLVAASPVVEPQGGTTALLYPLIAAETDEQIYYRWKITVLNATDVQVDVLSDPILIPPTIVSNYTVSGGISSIVPLGSSPHSVRFQPTVGASWILTVLQTPAQNLVDIYSSMKAGLLLDTREALFGVQSVEPYLSFKNIWETALHPSWQLGGLVLALGYRINELVG